MIDKKPGDWMENPQTLANIGHALAGACVVLTTVLFTHSWRTIGIVEALLTAYVLGKEYWYDLRYETGETVGSSTEDALGYLVGDVWAILMVIVAWYVVR